MLAKDKAHGRMHPGITLFIAGHTDTVGSASANLKLSQERARSIAGWFRKRGVRLPISYEGFGETSLAVKTADNVDEARNRRADYVLSDGPPTLRRELPPKLEADPVAPGLGNPKARSRRPRARGGRFAAATRRC